jgi:hypothetical protein
LGFSESRLTTDDAKILQYSALYFCNSASDCMLAPPFLQGTACNVANVSQFLVMRDPLSSPVFAGNISSATALKVGPLIPCQRGSAAVKVCTVLFGAFSANLTVTDSHNSGLCA